MFNMRNVLGLVFTEQTNVNLGGLISNRAPAAVPIAGKYRLIDFVLSNMVNSGIVNVGVTTHHHYSSLMDHLGSGREWDLDRKNNGLFILPPYSSRDDLAAIKGSIDVLHGVMNYLKKSVQEYVILANGMDVYSIDFSEAVTRHIENDADMTIIYKNDPYVEENMLSRRTMLEIDAENRITGMEVAPRHPATRNHSLGVYILAKELLMSIVDECYAHNEHDFLTDRVLNDLLGLRIFAHEFKGFAGMIDSIPSYYAASMMFLREEVRHELFGDRPVYTKVRDDAPAKYGSRASVDNSLIADGCVIEGSVKDSIIFRGVQIKPGAVIKDSIVMQESRIGEACRLECVILDKETVVHDGKQLVGQVNYPIVVEKRSEI